MLLAAAAALLASSVPVPCLGDCVDSCLSTSGPDCCDPGTFIEVPAPLDVAGAGFLGGVGGELVLLTLASPIAAILESMGNPVTLDAFAWVMAAAWPLGAGGYAAERADARGGNAVVVGLATGAASAAVVGTGMVLLEANKGRSDVDGATFVVGVLAFLGGASVAGGVTAGVAQLATE